MRACLSRLSVFSALAIGLACCTPPSTEAPPPSDPAPSKATPSKTVVGPDARSADGGPADADTAPATDAATPVDAARPIAPAGQVPWPAIEPGAAPVDMVRAVAIGDRWLYAARSEVTADDWHRIAGRTLGRGRKGSTRPVVGVTAGQAAWFCNRLSEKAGLEPCYAPCKNARRCKRIRPTDRPCDGYRLPTADEWRAMARGVDIEEVRRASRRIRPEAKVCKVRDARGLCDVYGGVWEWTETVHEGGRLAVRVGGSWAPDHREYYDKPLQHKVGKPKSYLGFRPVRVIADPAAALGRLGFDPIDRSLTGPLGRAPLTDGDMTLLVAISAGGGVARVAGIDRAVVDHFVMTVNRVGGFVTRSADRLMMPLARAESSPP